MLCARCHKNKSVHLFSPCMKRAALQSHVFCRVCVSEMQGYEFGQIGKCKAYLKARGVELKREEDQADALARLKRESEKKHIADLLEKRRKRLAGE